MDKYGELKDELEELKEYVYKMKKHYEDMFYNLDEDNFADEFKNKYLKG